MLIIGHKGAAGLETENTVRSFKRAVDEGVDIIEFDVRLTSDKIPILSHDPKIYDKTISKHTLAYLQKHGEITELDTILKKFFGKVLLNLEYKPAFGTPVVLNMVKKYIKTPDDWDNIYISSFHIRALARLRQQSKDVNLALLHSMNALTFVPLVRPLRLTAVGWHRLHTSKAAIRLAKRAKLFTYVYTVNREKSAEVFEKRGIDGLCTDYPNRFKTN